MSDVSQSQPTVDKEEQDKEKEEGEEDEEGDVLEIPSPFPYTVGMFDNEDSLPDLDFHVDGLGAPLRLHRAILAAASSLVLGVMRSKTAARSGDADTFAWGFDTAATVDRRALVAALRFCYGAPLRVGTTDPAACAAVVAAVVRLQVRCARDVASAVANYAATQAARDVARGAEMLCACLAYPECCSIKNSNSSSSDSNPGTPGCALDRVLARTVLTRANLCAHYATVVDHCLMRLPPAYLDLAEYGPAHSEQSEFSVRLRYVRYHRLAPDAPVGRAVVARIVGTELSGTELAHLRTLGFLTTAEVAERCRRALVYHEEHGRAQLQSAAAAAAAAADARDAADARARVAEAQARALRRTLLFAPLAYTRSVRTVISTGHRDACHCGAAYDGARRTILSTSSTASHGRDLFVTRIVDSGYGTTERHDGLIPFRTQDRAPVYDGARYLYFAEHSFNGLGGRRFGRVDMAALVWEELPPLPPPKFAPWFGGCYHRGTVYAIDADLTLCAYSVAAAQWTRCRTGGSTADPQPLRVPCPNEFCGAPPRGPRRRARAPLRRRPQHAQRALPHRHGRGDRRARVHAAAPVRPHARGRARPRRRERVCRRRLPQGRRLVRVLVALERLGPPRRVGPLRRQGQLQQQPQLPRLRRAAPDVLLPCQRQRHVGRRLPLVRCRRL